MVPDGFGWFAMVCDDFRPGVTIRIRHGVAMDRPDPTWNGYGPIRIRPGGAMGCPWIGFGSDLDWFGLDLARIGSDLDHQVTPKVTPMLFQCGSNLTKNDFQPAKVTPM